VERIVFILFLSGTQELMKEKNKYFFLISWVPDSALILYNYKIKPDTCQRKQVHKTHLTKRQQCNTDFDIKALAGAAIP
jgi:hypothetical protein